MIRPYPVAQLRDDALYRAVSRLFLPYRPFELSEQGLERVVGALD